jgi:hypothetical protein
LVCQLAFSLLLCYSINLLLSHPFSSCLFTISILFCVPSVCLYSFIGLSVVIYEILCSYRNSDVNLLKPSGFCTYHQIERSKILHGVCFELSVLYRYQNSRRLFFLYINWLVFITVVESVYCAVVTDSLYKADYVSYLKG